MGIGIFVSKWISLYLHTLFMHVGKCKLQKCPERGHSDNDNTEKSNDGAHEKTKRLE